MEGVRADLSLELASRDLGGDFDFRRLIAHLRGRHSLAAHQALAARLLLGVTGGDPPRQRRFALGGLGTLRGRSFKEFSGGNMALLSAEWAIHPASPWPAPLAFYDGGAVWGSGAGSGWKSDLGLGLEWGLRGQILLRVDGAFPLNPAPGRDGFRLTARLRAPF